MVTGTISGLITLDFDGEPGRKLAERWKIFPHRRTPSGLHWDVTHPGFVVPTLNGKAAKELARRWSGLDIKGDGGYAIFCGRNQQGEYTWLRSAEPDPPELVPCEVWDFIKAQSKTANSRTSINRTRVSEETLIRRALDCESSQGRNNTGFGLALQLRDNKFTETEAVSALLSYQSRARSTNSKGTFEAYSSAEAAASVRQAYSRAPRESWTTSTTGFRQPSQPTAQVVSELDGPDGLHVTSMGNAERFLRDFGNDVRWLEGPTRNSSGTFFVWDGGRWREDNSMASILAGRTVSNLNNLVALAVEQNQKSDAIKTLVNFWRSSENDHRIEEILSLARWKLSIKQSAFDADPDLLGVRNGVIDLRTGELRSSRREDYITKQCNVDFDPKATCPKFEASLLDATAVPGQTPVACHEFIGQLQQCIGISCTGHTKVHIVIFVIGPAATGKTTLCETISFMLGDYALGIDPDSLAAALKTEGSRPRPDIARLPGIRMALANESREGLRLDAGLVKALSGGDTITVRNLYGKSFDFVPTHKLWLRTNKEPQFDGSDTGMQRRVRKFPFEHFVQRMDPDLPEKLRNEAAGILNWAIRGLMSYRNHGLHESAIVKTKTEEYIRSLDIIAQFVEEQCEIGPYIQPAGALYERYKSWIVGRGQHPVAVKRFKDGLTEKGFQHHRTNTGQEWQGIRLNGSM